MLFSFLHVLPTPHPPSVCLWRWWSWRSYLCRRFLPTDHLYARLITTAGRQVYSFHIFRFLLPTGFTGASRKQEFCFFFFPRRSRLRGPIRVRKYQTKQRCEPGRHWAAHAEPNMAACREAAQLIKQANKHLVVVCQTVREIDTLPTSVFFPLSRVNRDI